MNIILCIDDNGGLMFNRRRQSRDRIVIQKICSLCQGRPLWINNYSSTLFKDTVSTQMRIDDAFLSKAQKGDYAFVENCSLIEMEDQIEKFYIFKWNRVYPRDFSFDIPLDAHGWKLISSEDFSGNSHEKITLEVYRK